MESRKNDLLFDSAGARSPFVLFIFTRPFDQHHLARIDLAILHFNRFLYAAACNDLEEIFSEYSTLYSKEVEVTRSIASTNSDIERYSLVLKAHEEVARDGHSTKDLDNRALIALENKSNLLNKQGLLSDELRSIRHSMGLSVSRMKTAVDISAKKKLIESNT
jgi:hypothetical protein